MKISMKKSKFLAGFITVLLFLAQSCAKDPVIVTGLDLDKINATVQVGATTPLITFLTPADATNQNITWRSANQAVAKVTDGVVTGVAIGTTTITANSQSDTTIKATCSILVTPSTGQVITVSGDITADTKWYANAKYFLSGFVYVKNNAVLTIEPGTIIHGVSNTKAALMTRGIAEITRVGVALGAHARTFAGLSGIGDLMVTCMSRHSRNRFVGIEIGKGRKLPDILSEMVMVAEGVETTKSARALARKAGVETPIVDEVYKMLFEGKNPHDACYDLMTRDPKGEM